RDPARSILSGLNLTKLRMAGRTPQEIRTQIPLTRSPQASGARGFLVYPADQRVDVLMGMPAPFRDQLNPPEAAPPPHASARDPRTERPRVELDGATLTVAPPAAVSVRAYAVYAQPSGELLRPVRGTSVTLEPGEYAVSAID